MSDMTLMLIMIGFCVLMGMIWAAMWLVWQLQEIKRFKEWVQLQLFDHTGDLQAVLRKLDEISEELRLDIPFRHLSYNQLRGAINIARTEEETCQRCEVVMARLSMLLDGLDGQVSAKRNTQF